MRWFVLAALLVTTNCKAQGLEGELLVGASGYNGDLTERVLSAKTLHPAFNFNLKYNTDDFVDFRIGVGWGTVSANDKNNKSADIQQRGLSFQSNILEVNVCAEFNLLDPDVYYAYPYVFLGVGVFHFDPFTYDDTHTKVYLQPLSTEGQGLAAYPDRKKYSLTQACLPFGLGWKANLSRGWQIGYEFGYRLLFTDYLDDVSKTYVNLQLLSAAKGPTAAALSYRRGTPFNEEGAVRGNDKIKDLYFFSGLKLTARLGKRKSRP